MALSTSFASIPQRIADIWNAVVQFFADTWAAIVQGAVNAGQSLADGVKAGVDVAIGYVKGLYDSVISIFKSIISQAAAVGSAIGNAFSGGGGDPSGAQANARGGHIRGPGTGTSDSILSWLSNGEFVIRAAAVKKFGVGLFQMLNNLQNPGFASGGFVQSMASAVLPPMPRFAAGGLVMANVSGGSGGRPFTLQIGDEVFGGMTAPDATVERLQKYATRKKRKSAGRAPTWEQG